MSEFAAFVEDVFREFGEVHCRKMFGGYGVFYQGTMFALIAEDTLYLKTDKASAEYYRTRDLPQFQYTREGKPYKMSYFQAPEEIFDDPSEAVILAKQAYAIALQSAADTARKRPSPRKK